MAHPADIVIIGAGAAGMMAAIFAGRTAPGRRIVALDGARHLGAKILVAGGGRCNVTHDRVDERAFAGSTPAAIRKVLRRFDVPQTVEFFRELGVELKREETGKLFPVTDRARTVLEALVRAARAAGVELVHPWRVESITRAAGRFALTSAAGEVLEARRVVIATGGMSLPRTGSDGHGYRIVQALGHTVTRTFPGLVPLTLAEGHFVRGLAGLTAPAEVQVRSAGGRKLQAFTGPVLCTHFGVSGPAVLDISRHYLSATHEDPGAMLIINWLPGEDSQAADALLAGLGRTSPGRALRERLPHRLADAICASAGADPSVPGGQLVRERRRALARALTEAPLAVTGQRGFQHAEVTAGGVPLSELHLETMESRLCPGLFLVGEICDVDGRIGGYNFQWAWASGFTAGVALGRAEPRPASAAESSARARSRPPARPHPGSPAARE